MEVALPCVAVESRGLFGSVACTGSLSGDFEGFASM